MNTETHSLCHKIVTNTPWKGMGVGAKQQKSVKSAVICSSGPPKRAILAAPVEEPEPEPQAPYVEKTTNICSPFSATTDDILDAIVDMQNGAAWQGALDELEYIGELIELALFDAEELALKRAAARMKAKNEPLMETILTGMATRGLDKKRARFLADLADWQESMEGWPIEKNKGESEDEIVLEETQ